MDAVILAAGQGTRLGELTQARPKCLIRVNGVSILDRQLEALLTAGVARIVIVTGFHAEQILAHVNETYPDEARIECLQNHRFASTNNMFSLHLCRDVVGTDGFLLLNADVVLDPTIITDLTRERGSRVCVDAGVYIEESMKVVLDPASGALTEISKTIDRATAFGCSIDVYRFDKDSAVALFEETRRIIEQEQRLTDWTEVALDRAMRENRLRLTPYDIRSRYWFEIDTLDDLLAAEQYLARQRIAAAELQLAFVDMDGTLYKGTEDVPGAARFVARLRQKVPHVYFLSNNSSRDPTHYRARLARVGIEADEAEILLSSLALRAYLEAEHIERVFLVGTAAFAGVLRERGIGHDPDKPEAVVVGFDSELTYEKLRTACLLLQDEAMPFFATHEDRVCPTEQGDIPDAGAILALIETTTGRRPQATFGKPSAAMVTHIYERHGVRGEQSVFFGDRVYTDYAMARACDALFVGVLTGEATRTDFEGTENSVVVPSVGEVFTEEDDGPVREEQEDG